MIYVEDQAIKVNGVVLPGLLKSIEVRSAAKIDEQQVEGSSAKPKQATGYEDVKISIELILDDTPTQTKYERLAVVRALFRKPGQAVPQPIPIVSEDTAAHGVNKVLFKGMSHKVDNKKDQIPVTLEFLEYVPQSIKTQKSTSSSGSKGTGKNKSKSSGSSKKPSSKYGDYLKSNRGKSPKLSQSPAVDLKTPYEVMPTVYTMPFFKKG